MILVAGDLLLDILLLPELRQPEQPEGIVLRPGGSAANTAAWIAHLGGAVTFTGCIGDDPIGAMLVEEMEQQGVHVIARRVAGMETGAVVVEIDHGAQRVMRSSRGANTALAPEDIQRPELSSITVVHLTGYALLGPPGFALLRAAGELAREHGALLSFDPSSPSAVKAMGRELLLAELLRCGVGLLLPNQDEAAALMGTSDSMEATNRLRDIVPAVAIKNGQDGYTAADGDGVHIQPMETIVPRDTTGAGDAFNAGVLFGLSNGDALSAACRRGHAAALGAISALGGRPPLIPTTVSQ